MSVQDLKHTCFYRIVPLVAVQRTIREVRLKVMVACLKSSDHNLSGHRVLVFDSLALVKSLPHHENGVAVEAVLELDVGELTHRDTHGVLQVLLLQVLNLEFLLVNSTLVFKARGFLPVSIYECAGDRV